MDFLKARTEPTFKRFEAIVLCLYAGLVSWITYYHEPWSDEAQAWLIARDSSLPEIFLKRLHYEGTPGLWHFLLWIFCRLHLSYAGMHWATALIGVATIYLLLRYAPFPAVIRAALAFSFPLVFQTAIIARSYSLVPLLAFLACIVLTSERKRPLAYAVLIGLLANTSLFAAALAVGMAPLYLLRLGKTDKGAPGKSLFIPCVTLALLFLFAAYTALPAPDISFGPGEHFASKPAIRRLLSKLTGIPPASTQVSVLSIGMKPAPPDLVAISLAKHFAPRSLISREVPKAIGISSIAFFTVSQFNLLAILFYGSLLWWLKRRHTLVTLFPLVTVLVAGYYLGLSEHHTSIIAVAIIVPLWLSWNRNPIPPSARLHRVFQVVLLVVLIEQMAWTAYAAVYDIRQPFDGSVAAAHFILPKVNKYRVASIGIEPLSIQPYARHNIFYNQSSTYWPWRLGVDPDSHLAEVVAQHPDFILDGEAFTGNIILPDQIVFQRSHWSIYDLRDKPAYLWEHGYHETHRFCGLQPAHFGFCKETCEVVYEPRSGKKSKQQGVQ